MGIVNEGALKFWRDGVDLHLLILKEIRTNGPNSRVPQGSYFN